MAVTIWNGSRWSRRVRWTTDHLEGRVRRTGEPHTVSSCGCESTVPRIPEVAFVPPAVLTPPRPQDVGDPACVRRPPQTHQRITDLVVPNEAHGRRPGRTRPPFSRYHGGPAQRPPHLEWKLGRARVRRPFGNVISGYSTGALGHSALRQPFLFGDGVFGVAEFVAGDGVGPVLVEDPDQLQAGLFHDSAGAGVHGHGECEHPLRAAVGEGLVDQG